MDTAYFQIQQHLPSSFPLSLASMASAASSSAIPLASSTSPASTINRSFSGFRSSSLVCDKTSCTFTSKTVSNGNRINCMQVINPFTNTRYETLSYVPPLTADNIAKQVDYIVSKGWIPCLEFDNNARVHRTNYRGPCYYDGRYWTLWKLPMFGCQDSAAVLREIDEAKKAYPNSFIRLLGFDSKKQVQCVAVVVHKPETA